jgi:hypothetical protein
MITEPAQCLRAGRVVDVEAVCHEENVLAREDARHLSPRNSFERWRIRRAIAFEQIRIDRRTAGTGRAEVEEIGHRRIPRCVSCSAPLAAWSEETRSLATGASDRYPRANLL